MEWKREQTRINIWVTEESFQGSSGVKKKRHMHAPSQVRKADDETKQKKGERKKQTRPNLLILPASSQVLPIRTGTHNTDIQTSGFASRFIL